jgi:hypothetical protein
MCSLGNQSQVTVRCSSATQKKEGEVMKNQEILEERARLQAKSKAICDEWQAYDRRYPVLPGAFKPPDYDNQQRALQARLCAVSNELRALPRTTSEKLRQTLTWFLIVAAIAAVVIVVF